MLPNPDSVVDLIALFRSRRLWKSLESPLVIEDSFPSILIKAKATNLKFLGKKLSFM
jgi:hypothetical protein